jgi:CheY-like chemotaxis protein
MPAPAPTAGPCAFDWSVTDLGASSTWPASLQLAVDVVHNTPLPMLLMWGPRRIAVFNTLYADFAGLRPASVPGGYTPAVLPQLVSKLPDAFEQALAGEAACIARQPLGKSQDGGGVDVHLTPVRDGGGAVTGVLCAIAPPSSAPVAQAAGPLRILVVEDNLDSQYLVCEMLKAFGHDAEGVGHAEGALTMLAATRYDVLFSDVSLPGMSGVDMARQAVADQPTLQVIFASGYGDALLRHLDFPHQSLQKPYELEHLQAALSRVSASLHRGV